MAEALTTEITPADIEAVRQVARVHSLDRYLSALLAPRAIRTDLIALAAFAGEIERVPLVVSEPALGEIRLKWWADWLNDLEAGTRTGNPVADVFGWVVRRRAVSPTLIGEAIEARAQELYAGPFANEGEYRDFLCRTEGSLFRVAGEIARTLRTTVGGDRFDDGPSGEAALMEFGIAYGGARQLLRLPMFVARGRWPLASRGDGVGVVDARFVDDPDMRKRADARRAEAVLAARTALAGARSKAISLSPEIRVGGLPAALVAPYLVALERQGDWLTSVADIAPLARIWRLWLAHMSRRL
ncbi:MAG: squalene/phytoene synthase family protein [Alphaproteobacteria bacterium]|nr:squalene/phytoene synthase family protein [Alphaproteobacteria bacterium]